MKVLKENIPNLDHFVLENDLKYLLFLDVETYSKLNYRYQISSVFIGSPDTGYELMIYILPNMVNEHISK